MPTVTHFWTTDPNGELLVNDPHWFREGPACYVLPATQAGAIPLYRFVDRRIGYNHFWSTDASGEALGPGYMLEGPCCYVFPNQVANTVPFYRWYSPSTNVHFWTSDPGGELLPKPDFHNEGAVFYVYSGPQPGATAFYRFLSGANPSAPSSATLWQNINYGGKGATVTEKTDNFNEFSPVSSTKVRGNKWVILCDSEKIRGRALGIKAPNDVPNFGPFGNTVKSITFSLSRPYKGDFLSVLLIDENGRMYEPET